MQKHLSLRSYLLLSFWILLILSMLLPTWYYYRNLTQQAMNDAREAAVRQLNLFHALILNDSNIRSVADLQTWFEKTAGPAQLRLTYVAAGGRVIADSQVPASSIRDLDNHASRPEIMQARTEDVGVTIRYSRVSGQDQIFVARRIQPNDPIPPGILRLAGPISPLKGLLDRLWNSFLIVTALIFLASVVLSYALIRQLRLPIGNLVEVVEALGTGDYGRRSRLSPGHEFFPLAQAINRTGENFGKKISEISEEKQQLEAVFDGMQEGVMVLDSRGKIRTINRALSELIATASNSVGKRPLEVIMSLELQEACDLILSSSSTAVSKPYNLQIVLGGNRTYDVTIVGFPERKRGMGAIAVFHDISELKRLETVRQDFVANVSHELRTPLTSIKGYTETLLAEKQPDPQMLSSFLQVIAKNTNHMVSMVDDLLRLARLESRHQSFKPAPVDPADAITAAWKACAPLAESKNIVLKSDIAPHTLHVSADYDQLVQVFRNLLENGIKYSTSDDELIVSCRIEGNRATFGIRDNGPGIPKQHQHRIFERFYRVEKHRSTHPGSTGLGLAICRHIIRNHGGRIWVESPNPEEDKGCTFFFTMFLARKDAEQEAERVTDAVDMV